MPIDLRALECLPIPADLSGLTAGAMGKFSIQKEHRYATFLVEPDGIQVLRVGRGRLRGRSDRSLNCQAGKAVLHRGLRSWTSILPAIQLPIGKTHGASMLPAPAPAPAPNRMPPLRRSAIVSPRASEAHASRRIMPDPAADHGASS